MNIFYSHEYNIDLGVLNSLHPFDGKKFSRIASAIEGLEGISISSPEAAISNAEIENFVDSLLVLLLQKKRYILRALEVPNIPLVPYSFIDKRVLLPMRWGVAGTLDAARKALNGTSCWNLSGGYHHASRASAEGFCVYNDIGIAFDILTREGALKVGAKVLIIDIDAHHGDGNAYVFMENRDVTILDIYNDSIYPAGRYTKERVDINIPLAARTDGDTYLTKLNEGLISLPGGYDLAFVIAGTDVLDVDPLGGLGLTIQDCVERDSIVANRLRALSVPTVFVGGGGYSKQSANATAESIKNLYKL